MIKTDNPASRYAQKLTADDVKEVFSPVNSNRLWVDGSYSAKPAPRMGVGVVDENSTILTLSIPGGTSVRAEYWALYHALNWCSFRVTMPPKAKGWIIYTDSKLVANQMNHKVAIRDPWILSFYKLKIHKLLLDEYDRGCPHCIRWIDRKFNVRADAAARGALKSYYNGRK